MWGKLISGNNNNIGSSNSTTTNTNNGGAMSKHNRNNTNSSNNDDNDDELVVDEDDNYDDDDDDDNLHQSPPHINRNGGRNDENRLHNDVMNTNNNNEYNDNDDYDDDDDHPATTAAADGSSSSNSVLGNRFSYMGRIATRFMEQVAPIHSHDDDEDDEDGDEHATNLEANTNDSNAWGNDNDDDDEFFDSSTSSEQPPPPNGTTATSTTTTTTTTEVVVLESKVTAVEAIADIAVVPFVPTNTNDINNTNNINSEHHNTTSNDEPAVVVVDDPNTHFVTTDAVQQLPIESNNTMTTTTTRTAIKEENVWGTAADDLDELDFSISEHNNTLPTGNTSAEPTPPRQLPMDSTTPSAVAAAIEENVWSNDDMDELLDLSISERTNIPPTTLMEETKNVVVLSNMTPSPPSIVVDFHDGDSNNPHHGNHVYNNIMSSSASTPELLDENDDEAAAATVVVVVDTDDVPMETIDGTVAVWEETHQDTTNFYYNTGSFGHMESSTNPPHGITTIPQQQQQEEMVHPLPLADSNIKREEEEDNDKALQQQQPILLNDHGGLVVDHTPQQQYHHHRYNTSNDEQTDTVFTDHGVAADVIHSGGGDDDNKYTTTGGSTFSVATYAESEDLTRDTGYVNNNNIFNTGNDGPPGETMSVYVNDNVDDINDVYDLENEQSYGPVVDHTPRDDVVDLNNTSSNIHTSIQFVRCASMAVQTGGYRRRVDGDGGNDGDDDDDDDDDDDAENKRQPPPSLLHATTGGDDTVFSAGESVWAEDTLDDSCTAAAFERINNNQQLLVPCDSVLLQQTNVVDLTPAMVSNNDDDTIERQQHHGTTALSIGAIASIGETVDIVRDDEDDDKDENHNFGLVVDITPPETDKPIGDNNQNDTTIFVNGNATSDPTATTTEPNIHSDVTVDGGNTLVSMAPNVGDIEVDFADDEAMEETYYGGDSTIGGAFTVEVDDDETDNMGNIDDDDDDDDVGQGDGWGSEDEDIVLSTIDDVQSAEELVPPLIAMNKSPLVDHTPSEMPTNVGDTEAQTFNPSIIALAMSEDETRNEGIGADDDDEEVYDDENEEQFGPVVDHTPQQQPRVVRTSSKNTAELAVLAIDVPSLGLQGGIDVMLDLTSFNGSTLGETDAAAAGADDWVEDDDDEQEEDGFEEDGFDNDETTPLPITSVPVLPNDQNISLVDCTPSEMDSPTKEICDGQSIQAHGSIATNTIDNVDEGDSIIDNNVTFGLVVDHLPPNPEATAAMIMMASRSDSVLVQGRGDADSVDTTVMGGGSRIDYGDELTYSHIRSNDHDEDQKDADQVVDFIPLRFESRHGGGSTFVAADPSEVLSEVDDLIPEEQNFGPVVDLTPPVNDDAILFSQGLGEGSVAVFAPPSVAADDLDQEDEGDADTEQAGWHPPAEEEPNPQSGIEEAVVVRHVDEQVVDFVPLPINVTAPSVGDGTREALSEMTVGGAQSLLQVGDPVEDDFGPVVDQLPSVAARSRESISTQVSASECRAMENDDNVNGYDDASSIHAKTDVVIDQLPLVRSIHPVDSTATMGKSLLTEEDEEEEEDASKFGPVVDQLPTSRASLAPSHGGSTVDALATVSEVNSDDEGDTWDDDYVDFDASFGGASESISRLESSSSAVIRPPVLASTHSIETDRSVRFAMQQPEMTDKSFAEADTPPSTPYRRLDGANIESRLDHGPEISLPMLPRSYPTNSDNTDYSQLFQEEVVRRRLVEAELETLKIFAHLSSTNTTDANVEAEIAKERQGKEVATVKLLEQENEAATLRELNAKLLSELKSSRDAQSSLQIRNDSNEAKASALEAEVQVFKSTLGTTSDDKTSDFSLKESVQALQLAIAEKSGECKELSTKVEQLESRLRDANALVAERDNESAKSLATMNQTITSLNVQIFGSGMLLKNSELSRIELERKIQVLDSEVIKLRLSSTKVASIQVQHEKDLQQQYKLLDMKSAELRNLEEVIEQLRQEKLHIVSDLTQQRALADQSELLANELISVAKERDMLEQALNHSREAILSLQTVIEQRGKERHALDLKREQDVESLKVDFMALQTTLTSNEEELTALSSQVESLTNENVKLTENLSAFPEAIRALEMEAYQAKADAEKERQRADALDQDLAALKNDLEVAIEKGNELELELVDANAKVNDLEQQMKRVDELESKCVTLVAEVDHFQSMAESKVGTDQAHVVDELVQEKARLLEENEEMLVQFGLIKQQMDHSEENERILHAELNAIRIAALDHNATTIQEMTQLRLQCDTVQERMDTVTKERDALFIQQEMWDQQVHGQSEQMKGMEQSRNELSAQLQNTIQQLTISQTALTEQERLTNTALKESQIQIQSLECTLQDRTQQLAYLETRMNELMTQQQQEQQDAAAGSQEDIVALQEQIDVLNTVLQSTRDRLAIREGDVDKLCLELHEIKQQQQQLSLSFVATGSSSSSTTTTTTINKSTDRRSPTMIEQAIQLKRSDSIRLLAMERIEQDRRASMDALQQLAASVTKYLSQQEQELVSPSTQNT